MLVECLAGSLVARLGDPPRKAPQDRIAARAGVSAFLMVLNPARITAREAFDASAQAWLAEYLEATGAGARYPGQRQAECEAERATTGIPMASSTVAELQKIGRDIGPAFDLAAVE